MYFQRKNQMLLTRVKKRMAVMILILRMQGMKMTLTLMKITTMMMTMNS